MNNQYQIDYLNSKIGNLEEYIDHTVLTQNQLNKYMLQLNNYYSRLDYLQSREDFNQEKKEKNKQKIYNQLFVCTIAWIVICILALCTLI